MRMRLRERLGYPLSQKENDVLLRDYLEGLSSMQLIELCRTLDACNSQNFSAALNQLPDNSALIDICFASRQSTYGKDYNIVSNSFDLDELYFIVDKNADDSKYIYQNWDDHNPKGYLVEQILDDSILRQKVLDIAHVKSSSLSRIDHA